LECDRKSFGSSAWSARSCLYCFSKQRFVLLS
jgi:hypothetical protein